MILLCGLGNPGAEYAGTRHNIGFMAADAIARHFNVTFSKQSRLLGKPLFESAALTHAGTRYTVIKPLTFMNNSGSAVAYVAGKTWHRPHTKS
ncbi:MAG: peptidyl-tRNA hydrolase [Chlorobi bacterium OLB6]|nr:MAG: peptidyl-tRNA hydrolase [Chlorobi bacterium OLB6]